MKPNETRHSNLVKNAIIKLNVKAKSIKTLCGQNAHCYKCNLAYIYHWALKAKACTKIVLI